MAQEIEIKPNTIVYFQANYIEESGKKAKARRHIVLEVKGNDLFLLKLTSQKKGLYARRATGYTECLDKTSYAAHSPKVQLSLTDLKINNFQYFYICPFGHNGCLDKEKFVDIQKKTKEYWEDEWIRDKKVVFVKASELEKPEKLPWSWTAKLNKLFIKKR